MIGWQEAKGFQLNCTQPALEGHPVSRQNHPPISNPTRTNNVSYKEARALPRAPELGKSVREL
jgi:hypothetical protein